VSDPQGAAAPVPEERIERLVIVARLKEGSGPRASELVSKGPPFDPADIGFDRHSVHLSPGEVVFLFEGQETASKLSGLIDNMVASASFSAWGALLEGTPRLAHEAYFWERPGSDAG
jgi:hypothetical protein